MISRTTADSSTISDVAHVVTQPSHTSDQSMNSDVATRAYTPAPLHLTTDNSMISDLNVYVMQTPAVTPSTASITTLDWWNQMGPWRDADLASGLAGNGYALLQLIDAIGYQYDITEQYTRDDPNHVGWGQLLDINICPTFALSWLAQFVGVNIPLGLTDAQMRQLIINQTNAKRGTAATLVGILQSFLTSTRLVQLFERNPDPYSFIIICQLSQMPGGAGGVAAIAARAALIAAKPAGLIMSFLIQEGLTWDEMVNYPISTLGRWQDQTDTWDSLSSEIPV